MPKRPISSRNRLSNAPLLILICYEAIFQWWKQIWKPKQFQVLFSGIQFHIWSVCLRKLKELQFQCVAIPFILHWYSLLYLEVCQCGKAWSPPMRHITPTRSSFWPEPALYSISHLGKILSKGAINHFYASKM